VRQRTAKPKSKDADGAERFELNESKPIKSLAEEYEAVYMSQVHGAPSERQKKMEKAHEEISGIWEGLVAKLDALVNAHYVPKLVRLFLCYLLAAAQNHAKRKKKQPKVELTVLPPVAALNIEENMPMSVSAAERLAPQEVVPVTSDLKARDELTETERANLRRQKKQRQREHQAAKDARDRKHAVEADKKDSNGLPVKMRGKANKEAEQERLGKLLDSMVSYFFFSEAAITSHFGAKKRALTPHKHRTSRSLEAKCSQKRRFPLISFFRVKSKGDPLLKINPR
jgi:U3 small nucleolar ribonucleoprotein component